MTLPSRLVESRHLDLSLRRMDLMYPTIKALASPVRLKIIELLAKDGMNVNELSEKLDLPLSTVALNVCCLEEAGVIQCQSRPGTRGRMKLCTLRLDSLTLQLIAPGDRTRSVLTMTLPVGCYSLAGDIHPGCGLADDHAFLGGMDDPGSFYHPNRFSAQIFWFQQGFVEYQFPATAMRSAGIQWLELSFEACSKAPECQDLWKSDITVLVNGTALGVWTSPADFGERRGRLNPRWWSDEMTQHGLLKTWRVDGAGTFLDKAPLSPVTIGDLSLASQDYIAIRIQVPPKAQNPGGINIFGERFGDHPQGIVLRVGLSGPIDDSLSETARA